MFRIFVGGGATPRFEGDSEATCDAVGVGEISCGEIRLEDAPVGEAGEAQWGEV